MGMLNNKRGGSVMIIMVALIAMIIITMGSCDAAARHLLQGIAGGNQVTVPVYIPVNVCGNAAAFGAAAAECAGVNVGANVGIGSP